MKSLKFCLVVMIFVLLGSCKKSDSDAPSASVNIETQPSALAAYNNSSAGIYKGIMVGSTGYFKLYLKNGNDSVSCKFVFDGHETLLTSNSLQNWTPGQAIYNAVFSGKINADSVKLQISCNSDGSNVSVSVTYPGHVIGVTVFKETSTSLVKCYEGTYTNGSETGIFNLTVKDSNVLGYQKDSHGEGPFTGIVSGNKLIIENQTLFIDDNSISGTITTNDGTVLKVTGKRSL